MRNFGKMLVVAAVLGLPGFAAAEQPSQLCDHEKMEEGKTPTAEKSDGKGSDKAKKTQDKSDQKQDQDKASNKS